MSSIAVGTIFVLLAVCINPFTINFIWQSNQPFGLAYLIVLLDVCALFSSYHLFRWNSLKSYALLVGANGIVLALGIVGIELAYGTWMSGKTLTHLRIPRDVRIEHQLNELYPWKKDSVIYTRDHYGLRGNYSMPSSIDILTIGGSTTDQRYIDDMETWESYMSRAFKMAGKQVVIANAGIDGQTTFGHIEAFKHWFPNIPGLNPKYYMFYVGINDFHRDEAFRPDGFFEREEKDISDGQKLLDILDDHSAIFGIYQLMSAVARAKREGIEHQYKKIFQPETWTDQPMQSNYAEFMKERLDYYARRIKWLCDTSKVRGGRAIFVTQPTRRYRLEDNGKVIGESEIKGYKEKFAYNGVDHYFMMKVLNNKTLEVAEQCGAIGVDLASELKFDLAVDFYDDYHNTPYGAKKIGDYLYSKLSFLF